MDELTPVRLMSNSDSLKGHYYHTVEAYKVHKMWWENSRPQTSLHYHVQEADPNSWFRFSLCIGKGTAISFIQAKVANFGNDLAQQGWPNRTITGLNSLAELNAQGGDNWYHDTAKGWLHVKLVQSEDRTIGGDILDRITDADQSTWLTYQCGSDPGWADENGVAYTSKGLGSGGRAS